MSFDMKNVVDIHVHAGPSVAKRRVDAGDMLLDAQKIGYRGFVSISPPLWAPIWSPNSWATGAARHSDVSC